MDIQTGDPKYYVVGGPVQPTRACYLSRRADAELYELLSEGEYCHVLAQRQSGKTSLIAATAAKLWRDESLVAMVDLQAHSGEDPSENAGRWYYSIVYRIVRDLRIKADVHSWWAERGGLTNLQRLREFFQEIVLQETDGDIVIFFDKLEVTVGEPLAQELFACIRACFDARASNPDFARLTFALVGSSSPGELVGSVQGTPFEISRAVALTDFSPQELAGFVAGLGEPLDDAERVSRRVWSWTRGHPYLSQKVFRGLARRRDTELTPEIVDELVTSQFLAPNTLREEPHLSAIAERILQPGPTLIARLNLYGRLCKGVEVNSDPASLAQRQLITAGVVSIGDNNELRVRNEIYAMVFNVRWVNQNLPYGFRGMALTAAIAACLLAVPFWYSEFLPRPYVSALSAVNQDFQVAEDAYNTLSRLPGHGSRAESLYESYLVRTSRQAESLGEALLVNTQLENLQDGAARAPELLADFWERRSIRYMHAGDRDAALVAVIEAMEVPNDRRRRMAAELVGDDYPLLAATARSESRFVSIAVDRQAGQATLLDEYNTVQIWRLTGAQPAMARSLKLVAEERIELQQSRNFDPLRKRQRLLVQVNHPQPEQLQIQLRAPSGLIAESPLSAGQLVATGLYAFDFSRIKGFSDFAGVQPAGNWTLVLRDLVMGQSGEALGWDIASASSTRIADDAFFTQPIPEPQATDDADAVLSKDGKLAAIWPIERDTPGSILIWDIESESVIARIPRSANLIAVHFIDDAKRLMTLDGARAEIWDSRTGERLGEIRDRDDRLMLAGLSANGRFAAFRNASVAGELEVVVWDLLGLKRAGPAIKVSDVGPAVVAANGRLLALGGKDARVRVWTVKDGMLANELPLGAPARWLKFDASGEWLASDDLGYMFKLWKLNREDPQVMERAGAGPWFADFSADSSSLLFGSLDRAYEVVYLPEGRNAGFGLRHSMVDQKPAPEAPGSDPFMLPLLNMAVTTDVAGVVKMWSLPRNLETDVPVNQFPGGMRAALSQDGQRIALAGADDQVRIHAVGAPSAMQLGASNPEHIGSHEIVTLEFSPDRRWVAGGTANGRVWLWEAESGREIDLAVVHPDGPVLSISFSTDSQQLLSASSSEVQVTDLSSLEVVARLRIQANHPQLVVAAEANVLFVAGDHDGVTAWDWRTGAIDRIVSREYKIRNLAVSADGRELVTAGADRNLLYWDVLKRTPRALAMLAAGRVDALWFTQDSRRVLVQAGHWLHFVQVFPDGLAPRLTRLLDSIPLAVQPDASDDFVHVLSTSRMRPVIQKVFASEPPAKMLDGEVADLQSYWYPRVSLTVDEAGEIVPVVGAERDAPTVISQLFLGSE